MTLRASLSPDEGRDPIRRRTVAGNQGLRNFKGAYSGVSGPDRRRHPLSRVETAVIAG